MGNESLVGFRFRWPLLAARVGPRLGAGENGQSLVLVTLMMTVVMGMIALAVDGTFAYSMRSRMQMAADAAALGATGEIAAGMPVQTALNRAGRLLTANGADLAVSTVAISGSTVQVVARTSFDTFFASVIGFDQMTAAANSQAVYGQLGGTGNLMPFAVEEDVWMPGTVVALWGEQNGPGNFGWVRWTGQNPNTPTLQANITDPARSDYLNIGDLVSGHPGVSFHPVQSALNSWIGRQVTVFLYDPDEVSGGGNNLTYVVRGFARFELLNTVSHGSHSEIWGRFVTYTMMGGPVDLTNPNGPGSKAVGLLQ